MTREQGLELIYQLFIKEQTFTYHRAKYYFIALDGMNTEYKDNNSPEEFQRFMSFLESDYGKFVIRLEVSNHITAEELCRGNHLIWQQMCCNPKYDPAYAYPDYKPEGWGNLAFLQRTWDFEDDLATFPGKSPQEKNQFALNILETIQDTKQIMLKNEELYSQALSSLISPKDFSGKPWTFNPGDHTSQLMEHIDTLKKDLKQEIDDKVNQSVSNICNHVSNSNNDLMTKEDFSVVLAKVSNPMSDMYRIGLECNAFVKDPENPDRYLIKGTMQSAFTRWIKALKARGTEDDSIPTPSQIKNTFRVEGKNFSMNEEAQGSIMTAFEVAKRNQKPVE